MGRKGPTGTEREMESEREGGRDKMVELISRVLVCVCVVCALFLLTFPADVDLLAVITHAVLK